MGRAHPRILFSLRGVWPVLERELRAGAHRAFNYWLRSAIGAAALFIFFTQADRSQIVSSMGIDIFISLHALIVLLILTTIPAMMADCIAREKREGTLGLLFMTPLSAAGIVVGKCCAQLLRAWSFWLAILPILTIPFLLGGVTWLNVLSAIGIEVCVGLLALTGGLLIASTTKIRVMAIILAELTSLILFIAWAMVFTTQLVSKSGVSNTLFDYTTLYRDVMVVLQHFPNPDTLRFAGITLSTAYTVLGTSIGIIGLITFLSIHLAAMHIESSWRDKTPTVRQEWWLKRFCTELRQDSFKRKMQHTLDWNPIAFLQQYSWKNRLSKWGLCLLFVTVQSFYIGQIPNIDDFLRMQFWLLVVFAAMYTFVGVSSFLSEKQSGALELILITPLNVGQIISGRAWGLWKQFLPALLSLIVFNMAYARIATYYGRSYGFESAYFILVILMGFVSLPVFATYAALRVRYLLGAALLTWIGIFLGLVFGMALGSLMLGGSGTPYYHPVLSLFCVGISYAGFVGLTVFLLHHSLSERIYSF